MRRDMKKVWVAAGAVALALALGGGAWALGRASGAQGAPAEEELSASPRPDAGRAEVPEEPKSMQTSTGQPSTAAGRGSTLGRTPMASRMCLRDRIYRQKVRSDTPANLASSFLLMNLCLS